MKHTIHQVQLKNGAQGLLIDIPAATVIDFEFNFRAGEYLVERTKWEVPHIMEHMLLGANAKFRKSRLFQAEFEKNGAYSNAHTSTYHVTYEAECAEFEWQRILELMLLAISQPLFLREEFKAEFGNVKDERAARSNNHFLHLHAATREAYGLIAMTDRECLKQMRHVRLRDIVEHYQRTHTARNLRFIVAGNLRGKQEAIKRLIDSTRLPLGRRRLELPAEKAQLPQKPSFIYRPSVRTLHFYLDTFANQRFDDPQWDGLALVNSMLTATLNSRILGEARERGLVYSISSNLEVTRDSSSWWFGTQVIPKNAPALFEIIVRELLRIRSGDISPEDLEAAKQYLLGRHQLSAQTVGGTLAGYGWRYYFDGVIEDYEAIPERIKAVSKATIVEAANQMFTDRIGGLGVLGDSRSRVLAEGLNELIQPLWR
ncbi:insulinase family protein [Candidatus Saccharibacteria bacterium]|nr:insulinase family protein [Candidatus Saccharibacteria bacterium]